MSHENNALPNKLLWAVEEKRGNCDIELRNREKKTVYIPQRSPSHF